VVTQYKTADEERTATAYEGAEVMTFDNRRLGKVKEVEGDYIKVQVRLGKDYWLDSTLIREHRDRCIVLHVDRDGLPGYKLRKTNRGYEPMVRLDSDHAWDEHRLDS
jgi:hypothetical protein